MVRPSRSNDEGAFIAWEGADITSGGSRLGVGGIRELGGKIIGSRFSSLLPYQSISFL